MSYTPYVWKNLPDKSTPINAENLNRMEDGIQEALAKSSGSCSYVQSAGERYGNYYYEVYKYTVDNADSLISNAGLTNPYYYYEIEGWAKCTSISDDGLTANFSPVFQAISPDITTGDDFFYNSGGDWIAIPQFLCLGIMDDDDYAFLPQKSMTNAITNLYASIYCKIPAESDMSFIMSAEIIPTTSTDYLFVSSQVDTLCMYYKIKLDQVRHTSVG